MNVIRTTTFTMLWLSCDLPASVASL